MSRTPTSLRPMGSNQPKKQFYVVIEAGNTAPVVTPHPPRGSRVVAGPYDDYPAACLRATGLARDAKARRIANAKPIPMIIQLAAWAAAGTVFALIARELILAFR